MSDPSSSTLFSRLGNLFRRNNQDIELPLQNDDGAIEARGTFLRPWAKRDAAIQNLQDGFHTLTDLMAGIRENLERSSNRQDDLLACLSHLPEALQAIPENSRLHGETLAAIRQQLEQQNIHQHRLADVLEQLGESGKDQTTAIGEVREHVENMRQTDEAISAHLSGLGSALQSVSRNSTTGAQVLEQMRDRIDSRDGQLERILHKHNARFTAMLAIAIFLSIAALVAVSVIGYMMLMKH